MAATKHTYHQAMETATMVLFWKAPCCFCQWAESEFLVDGVRYVTAEQFMMAEKAKLFNDEEIWMEIMQTTDPKLQKALGRKVANFEEALWDANKFDIVARGNLAKFQQNKDMLNTLLRTGDKVLVEASPLDKIWGIGLAPDDRRAMHQDTWKGQNLLGKALMQVREELRTKQ